jgi:hypothetical protein
MLTFKCQNHPNMAYSHIMWKRWRLNPHLADGSISISPNKLHPIRLIVDSFPSLMFSLQNSTLLAGSVGEEEEEGESDAILHDPGGSRCIMHV